MAFRQGYAIGAVVELGALVGAIVVFQWMLALPGLWASKTIVALFALGMAWLLWARTRRTNLMIARFIAALDNADFTQSFRQRGQGSGFDELGEALDGAMRRLRAERAATASENRFAAALVDEAPTPLLAIGPDGRVQLANQAARRLFPGSDGRPIAAFAPYGAALASVMETIGPGSRRLARVRVDGLAQRAMLAAAEVSRQGERWRIISVEIIQGELDAAEIAAQIDLVRVLTHEIMNSMTPVTSLAGTAAMLMARADKGQDAEVADARLAVEALARRAAAILHFVESYREFSRTPTLSPASFAVGPWIAELVRLFAATPQGEGVAVDVDVMPPSLRMTADADLLGQVMLNLLKNGGEAARDHATSPRIGISVSSAPSGRVRIAVRDNGPGIPADLAEDVFLPFFTTKKMGTGVGLSFARQIVLLHKGAIAIDPNASGGSFEILV